MPRKRKVRGKSTPSLPILRPHAAGIDIGAREVYAAVPSDRDPHPVRCFLTFTSDLVALADWLKHCGIETVAMESTGVYWIPLFQILEARGFEVFLVNARHVKNVPGRKSDVSDCHWLQYLHSVGLLRASFRPPQDVCRVRSLLRHRDNLVQMAATHVQHMQKALDQMNLQLHHVISDLTGKTGLAILDAILAGERDAQALAQLRDGRIQASPQTIAKSLVGDYRPEHLFVLRQSLATYRAYQRLRVECDQEIATALADFDTQADPASLPPRPQKARRAPQRNQFHFDLQAELYRILGVDLTLVPGLETLSVHTCWAKSAPTCPLFPIRPPSAPGSACARIIASAAARSYPLVPGRSSTASPAPYAWPPSPSITVSLTWGNTTAACAPSWVLPKPSRPLPTSSPGSSTIC